MSRACGERVMGGCYVESGMSSNGHPIECYLYDLPMSIDADLMGLSSIGVKAIKDSRTGVTNLWDIIGRSWYPNVADWVEESRVKGVSRRVPANLPWAQLDERSRLVVLHTRAVIYNGRDYEDYEWGSDISGIKPCTNETANQHCTKMIPRAIHPPRGITKRIACARFWWQDIEGDEHPSGCHVEQSTGDVLYHGIQRGGGIIPSYGLGIVGVFPINRIAVIRDPHENSHRKVLHRVVDTSIPVSVENQ